LPHIGVSANLLSVGYCSKNGGSISDLL